MLSLLIFSPLLGIFLISLVPRRYEEGVRHVALFSSLVTLAISLILIKFYNGGWAFEEVVPWIPSFNIFYHVGVDGASLLLIALTAILTAVSVLASWDEITSRRKEFYSLLLVIEIGLIGVFSAIDLFLFYIFWEVMLIPMYFLIGIWGSGNRVYVALKFLLYTFIGSVVMLVGVIYLYLAAGKTFNILELYHVVLPARIQLWLFCAFAFAFAIKVPIVPFHTWLPDAHTEAPTAGSVMLAGVFLKVGAYGFYRIAMPIFPDAVTELRTLILVLAVIGITYGALVSMVQPDLKRLIAYSSVAHLGFVILGLISLTPEGVQGALLQMINHGLSTGALFLLVGMLYARRHTRMIADYGGLGRSVPVLTFVFVFVGLSSLGLPGLNNFVGEILVLIGAFKTAKWYAVIAASGVVLAAIYILWAIERVFFGEVREENRGLKDISLRETVVVAPLILLIVWLGVYPQTALGRMFDSAKMFLESVLR